MHLKNVCKGNKIYTKFDLPKIKRRFIFLKWRLVTLKRHFKKMKRRLAAIEKKSVILHLHFNWLCVEKEFILCSFRSALWRFWVAVIRLQRPQRHG
jgi:hypothetical protein